MTTVSEMNQRCYAVKLEILEEHRQHLHKAVDDLVSIIISAGKQKPESEEKPQYLQMFQNIDNAVEFLGLKRSEFSDVTKDGTLKFPQLLSGDSASAPEITSLSATTSAAEANREQTVTPGYSTERDMYSIQYNEADITTKQNNVRTSVEQNSSNESDVDILNKVLFKLWKRFEENETQAKKMTDKCDHIETLESDFQSLKTDLQKLSQDQNFLHNQIRRRINEDLENKLRTVRMEANLLRSSLTSTVEKNDSVLQTLSYRSESLEQDLRQLTEQISKNGETLETVFIKEEVCEVKMADIETRLALLETGDTEYLGGVRNRLDEAETSSKILCQMLANRLQPLEKLRQILNEKSRDQDENVTKLHEVVREVEAIPRMISAPNVQFRRLSF